jgi:type IV fimbrial biogenesis protein FimT
MKSLSGFTFFELLIGLCVSLILLMIAIPSFDDWIARHRAAVVIDQLKMTLNFARHESIRTGFPITWCPSEDLIHCSNDWSKTQIIFLEKNGRHEVDSENALLRIIDPINHNAHLFWRGFVSNQFIQIPPDSMSMTMNGRFQYCPASRDQKYARTLFVNRLGRMRVEKNNGGEGC